MKRAWGVGAALLVLLLAIGPIRAQEEGERRHRPVKAVADDSIEVGAKGRLPLRLGDDSLNAIPGGLRLRRDDGNFLPNQAIHKRGFPRIGAPDDSHKSGPKAVLFPGVFLCWHHGFTMGNSSVLGCSASCSTRCFATT